MVSLLSMLVFQSGNLAFALEPDRSSEQYVHTSWAADKGFISGSISSIAQSSDGYLWLGSERGLLRFDGYEFSLIDAAHLPGGHPTGPVRGLREDADGNLWIRLEGQDILRYHDGVFENVTEKNQLYRETFTAMGLDRTGHLLLWSPLLRTIGLRSAGTSRPFPRDEINGTVTSMVETAPGVLWLATRDFGLYRFEAGRDTRVLSETDLLSINALAPSDGGGVWVGSEKGLHLWEGGKQIPLQLPAELEKSQVFSLLIDHTHNLWVATDAGLYKIDPRRRQVTGVFHSVDDPVISAVFEDAEGDIWFANSHGLDRLRTGMFTAVSAKEMGIKEVGGAVFAASNGVTWFAPVGGGLYQLLNGVAHRIDVPGLGHDVIYSMTGNNDELWLGRQEGGLTQLEHRNGTWTASTFTTADGLAQNSVYTVTRAHDGSIWAGTVSGGISVLRNHHLTTFDVGPHSNAISSSLETRDHKMWFATPTGLACFDGRNWSTYGDTGSIVPLSVKTLFEDSNNVLWIGTSRGLARLQNGHIEVPNNLPDNLTEDVLGINEDAHGFLWILTSDRVLQVDRRKLIAGNLTTTDVLSYGTDDGLIETRGSRRDRPVVSDPSGRIWISLAHSLAVADMAAAENYRRPGRVRIDAVSLEGGAASQRDQLDLPAGTRSITFRYSGMNLAMPQRVLFRYRLDGLDTIWSNDTSLRQVVFSNLSPGNYTFRIMGSNALAAWNGPETTISFRIRPALWQTWYFRVVCGLILLGLGVFLYQARMMQVTNHLNERFKDRLAERMHIAQDLHDTLLQGVISASMQLDVAQDQIPEESPAKPALQRIVTLMGYVAEEGRHALRGLRTVDMSVTLETLFQRMLDDVEPEQTSRYSLSVYGSEQLLKPAVFDEVYRIGREAYRNAVAHATAGKIEVILEYGSRQLRLRVRDDGCGIAPIILKNGRDGHWGLAGMRERAQSIGAAFAIHSRVPGGTDVDLRVPAMIAYASGRKRMAFWPWRMRRERPPISETEE